MAGTAHDILDKLLTNLKYLIITITKRTSHYNPPTEMIIQFHLFFL